ncbi:hemolysin activation/secretion protein-like protein [Caballeronia cordobensis]|uniref:Hemolysin activation/secretion protein-like protein n=1 Tax=Caballeronia cordobensis TaxID=1353886 RepID=A0A158GH03_CABCO|nr:ShlB/FhaC/HecB family hemolysin secretion/activation protein [Caballeronia cordobensis]SAL31121.1 hemolysin activation/secretion protein-like protein [Caballeronia cordobensis]
MFKTKELTAATRQMLWVGSMLLVGVTSAKVACAADAGSLVQDSGAMDAAPVGDQSVASAKVVPGGGADALNVEQVVTQGLRRLGAAPREIKEVERWSDVLTLALRQGGYPLGQVLMTEQDWQAARQGGKPQFTVFPGRIGKISVNNKSRVADARLQRLITHALCGGSTLDGDCMLRTGRLERATQLLQDVPGVSLDGAPKVSAGASTGDIDVTFNIAQRGKPVSADLIFDNNGNPSTGTYRFGMTASANNYFGMGESYALTLMDTTKNMWTGSLTGSMPIFDDGLRLTAGLTRQQYNVNVGTPTKGVATTAQAGVQYPFMRGLDANLWGGASFLHSRSSTTFTELGSSTNGTINSIQLTLQGNNGERARALRSNMVGGQLALTLGHLSTNDFSDDVTHRGGNYAKLSGSGFATYNLTPSGNLFVSTAASAQLASRNLDGSEKLNLGGPTAVRAYRADEGSADEGAVLSVGLYDRVPIAAGHQLQFGVFSDFAYGRVNHSPWYGWENTYPGVGGVTNNRVLGGYGASLDWLTPWGATVSASIARPYAFSGTSWVEPGKKPTQYWLSVTWSH